MEKPKKSSLFKRVATALVLAPLTIALIYAGSPWINVLALVFGAMLSWEWAHMVPNRNAPFYATAYTASLSAAVLLNCSAAVAAVVAGASLLVWFKARGEERRNLLTLGVPYISVGIGSLIWLFGTVGFVTTLWFLIMVWCVDIGGLRCRLQSQRAETGAENQSEQNLVGINRRRSLFGCGERCVFPFVQPACQCAVLCRFRRRYRRNRANRRFGRILYQAQYRH